jgi:hypothetical protein
MNDRRRAVFAASRPKHLLAALAFTAIVVGCSSEREGSDRWTHGPTLAPGTAAPSESVGPTGPLPVGSSAPVGSVGPDTSQAPPPSSAP